MRRYRSAPPLSVDPLADVPEYVRRACTKGSGGVQAPKPVERPVTAHERWLADDLAAKRAGQPSQQTNPRGKP